MLFGKKRAVQVTISGCLFVLFSISTFFRERLLRAALRNSSLDETGDNIYIISMWSSRLDAALWLGLFLCLAALARKIPR